MKGFGVCTLLLATKPISDAGFVDAADDPNPENRLVEGVEDTAGVALVGCEVLAKND